MKKIWKYSFKVEDVQVISMPLGSEILSAQKQNNIVQLWVLCDPSKDYEDRTIEVIGTGNPIDDSYKRKFIDTFQLFGGQLVFHVFERLAA